MELSPEDKKNLDDLDKYDNYQWFVEITKYTPGQSFGELALLEEKGTRNATIHCICNCYFATLSRHDYIRLLEKSELK